MHHSATGSSPKKKSDIAALLRDHASGSRKKEGKKIKKGKEGARPSATIQWKKESTKAN